MQKAKRTSILIAVLLLASATPSFSQIFKSTDAAPAGTVIYVVNDPLGGDGYYTVEDKGSGVKGNHIDIYAAAGESYSTTTCEVYIVN